MNADVLADMLTESLIQTGIRTPSSSDEKPGRIVLTWENGFEVIVTNAHYEVDNIVYAESLLLHVVELIRDIV